MKPCNWKPGDDLPRMSGRKDGPARVRVQCRFCKRRRVYTATYVRFHHARSGYDGTCAPCKAREKNRAGVPLKNRRFATRYTRTGYIMVGKWGVPEAWRQMWDLIRARPGGNRYLFEHRVAMAVHLGRPLYPHETVHHRDGVRSHNAIENLQLFTRGTHHAGFGDFYQCWQEALSEIEQLKALLTSC